MPLSEYYGGHGKSVARDMKKRYGKRWKQVFYATASKLGLRPEKDYSEAEKILSGKKGGKGR